MITLTNIRKTYQSKHNSFEALKGVSLSIDDGEIFGIIGESGAGKSTLVRCINLLERPSSGELIIGDRSITELSGKELRRLRNDIGMIFQNFSLFQQKSVLDNVLFPARLAIAQRKSRAELEKRAYELIELVGLKGRESSYPCQLSGGQQQRVAIARALMTNPRILLCDEATSALDTLTTASVLALLKDINRRLGVTIVLITHSLSVARQICNRVAVMDAGSVVEEGTVEEIFSQPKSAVARALLGCSLGKAQGVSVA